MFFIPMDTLLHPALGGFGQGRQRAACRDSAESQDQPGPPKVLVDTDRRSTLAFDSKTHASPLLHAAADTTAHFPPRKGSLDLGPEHELLIFLLLPRVPPATQCHRSPGIPLRGASKSEPKLCTEEKHSVFSICKSSACSEVFLGQEV